jgi:hypothetical protein
MPLAAQATNAKRVDRVNQDLATEIDDFGILPTPLTNI